MKKIIVLAFVLLSLHSPGQESDSLTLPTCWQAAEKNYPLQGQKGIYTELSEVRTSLLRKNYLPTLTLNAQATYQSDVTELPIKLPFITIPEMAKDQYKASLDVQQLIFDGFSTQRQKNVEKASLETDKQSVEVELYKVRDRINQLYFSILLIQQNQKIMKNSMEVLDEKIIKAQSMVKNGVLLQSQLDAFIAEKLKLTQNISELNENRKGQLGMLNELTGMNLTENIQLTVPTMPVTSESSTINRPELELFNLQQNKLDLTGKVVQTKSYPRLYGFGQAGYGRPGLNMLSSDFDTYYLIGAKLSWTLWNWGQTKEEVKTFQLQKQLIQKQKEAFEQGIRANQQRDKAEFEKFNLLIENDMEILSLRKRIRQTSSSQFDNGTLTSSDYVQDHNAETQAVILLETHKIQLLKAKYDYLQNTGTEIQSK